MNGGRFSRLILLVAIISLTTSFSEAQSANIGSLWMASTLEANNDGVNGKVDCITTALDSSGNVSYTATVNFNGTYKGVSTVCNVYPVGSPDQPVWSSTNPNDAPSCSGGSFPMLGSANMAVFASQQYKSECKGTFKLTPGTAYQLTSQHYLWLVQDTTNCDSNDPWVDPLGWYDYILDDFPWSNALVSQSTPTFGANYDWWSVSQSDVTAQSGNGTSPGNMNPGTSGNWPSQGLSETEPGTPEDPVPPGSGDAGCISETILNSGAWELATTNATFTAISITPTSYPDTPANFLAFLPTQETPFNSNLSALQSVVGQGTDTLNWCLLETSGQCTTPFPTNIGAIDSQGDPNIANTTSNSETYYAPQTIPTQTAPISTVAICAQDVLQSANFACDEAIFVPLTIELTPASPTLAEGVKLVFNAALASPASQAGIPPPANELMWSADSNPVWSDWSTNAGPASTASGTCKLGTQTTTTAAVSQSVYTYCAPGNNTGSGIISVSANVNIPSGSSNLQLTASTPYTVLASLASQTINFALPSQTGDSSSISLTATASSGLAVSFYSTTPTICSVSGAAASVIQAGTCTIVAYQPGNADYSAASSDPESFPVTGPSPAPESSPTGGTYYNAPTVTLVDSVPGATFYYTTNGTTPTTSSTKYTGPTSVTNSLTVNFIAIAPGYASSPVTTQTYTLVAATPQVSLASGTYSGPQTVTITTASTGAGVWYTTNGTTPQPNPSVATKYTGPITIDSSLTLKVGAFATGYTSSQVVETTYTIQ